MWPWLVAGWCAVAVVLAVLHHRLRRAQPSVPPEVEQFLLRFETELGAFPQIRYLGLLPGQFACLLRIDGQETPVSLHELFRRAEAFPEEFPRVVAQLVEEIQDLGLDRVSDHEFGSVAVTLLPQVRSLAWVDEQGHFGDHALVHRKLSADLAVVYVIDDPQTMVFVCRAHLRKWARSEADIHQLALGNLARRGGLGNLSIGPDAEPVLLQTGDGYDAARVLLLEQTEGLLVALPDRDTLWIGREDSGQATGGLASLMAAAESMSRAAPHPVSDRLYRLKDGYLEAVDG